MFELRRILCVCVALFLSIGIGRVPVMADDSAVETLAKALPEDTIAFVAVGGGDTLKSDFDKTILGRICNDPGVQGFYQSVKTQLLAKMQQEAEDPNEVKQIDMVFSLARLVASRPVAVGVAQLKGPMRDKESPPVYGFAMLDAGARKTEFEAALKTLETLAGADLIADVNVGSVTMHGPKGKSPVPLYWGWSGNYLVAAVNDADGVAMPYLQKPRVALPQYLKKAPTAGNAIAVHANIQKAIGVVDALARQAEDAKTADTITAVLKELGLSNIRTFTSRAGFAGPDVVAGTFVEVVGPRMGLLAALKPTDPALMDMVDVRAVTASAANLDVAGVYDAVMRTVKTASGEAYDEIEKGISAFESEAKVSIRKGLLESLAGPIIFYSMGPGAMPAAPMGGGIALVKLKNAELFEKTMASLGGYAATQSKGAFQVGAQTGDDGRTVHTWIVPQLAMMQVMPTWSIADDYVVIGSNAAMHDLAIGQVASAGGDRKSIRETAGYKEVASRLPDNLLSLTYADSQTQYTQTMATFQQVWPMVTMFAAQADITLPAMLPSLAPIIKDMKPLCEVSWAGPDGIYSRYQGPGVDVSLTSVAGVSLGLGIAMPALARTRQLAYRMTSGTSLSAIGKACLIYANDHDDKLPPDLESLVSAADLPPKCFESKLKPKGFAGPSYIYIPGQTVAAYPGNIVAYDNPEFCTDGVNVLFLDSHVEFMKPDEFRRELQETCKRLGRPMPDVKFKGETGGKPQAPKPVSSSTM